ncbi:hypothetical protein AB6O49_03660 [Streptomyces sp. SBR177]
MSKVALITRATAAEAKKACPSSRSDSARASRRTAPPLCTPASPRSSRQPTPSAPSSATVSRYWLSVKK